MAFLDYYLNASFYNFMYFIFSICLTYSTFWEVFSTLIFNLSIECLVSVIIQPQGALYSSPIVPFWSPRMAAMEVYLSNLPLGRTCQKWCGWLRAYRCRSLESRAASTPSLHSHWKLAGNDWPWWGPQSLSTNNPGGWLRHSQMARSLKLFPSPLKAVRPASQTEGSPLLLSPWAFTFHSR